MARPGRIALGVALLSGALFAGAALGATPGVTAAEQERAVEFYKRVTDQASREVAQAFAMTYRRRAYLLDVDPVEKLAKGLLNKEYRIEDKDRLKYFAMSLDALVRGANLKDIQTTVDLIQDGSYSGQQKAQFIEDFLGVASRYSSPVPLAMLAEDAYDDGVVGQRLEDLLSWVISTVRRGEDPDHIKRIYDVVSRIAPSIAFQRDFLEKCFRAVRLGAPPLPLTEAVERMGNRFEIDTRLDEGLDRILRLYFSGQPFGVAVNTVVPVAEKKEGE